MQPYDLCVLFGGGQTEAEVDALAKDVDDLLAKASADVKFSHSLGRKKLAYAISGQTHGDYRCWLFLAEGAKIKEVEEKLRLNNSVLRHLLLRLEDVTIDQRIDKIRSDKVKPKQEEDEAEAQAAESQKPAPEAAQDKAPELAAPERKKQTEEKEEKKAGIEDLDKKLDELLESDKV